MSRNAKSKRQLRSEVTCPHCWFKIPVADIRWVSSHADLIGDPKLGADAQLRFLPSRFDPAGNALDQRGSACHDLACPACHLGIPWPMLTARPLFFSILGAPGAGKSYFLAAMTWLLRKCLGERFGLSLSDADPAANRILNEYEETLFLNSNPGEFASLPKTELEGDLYESARIEKQLLWFPKPFVFALNPDTDRSAIAARRVLCLYDNAGEHFLPGSPIAGRFVTKHLSIAESLFFVFDPTQDPRVRNACRERSVDPQLRQHGWSNRQDQVLHEAANRIRSLRGIPAGEKDQRPLIVVVTKYDAWSQLLDDHKVSSRQVIREVKGGTGNLDVKKIMELSGMVRSIFERLTPELVLAAEAFSNDVVFIPVSAMGCSPVVVPGGGFLGVRPADVNPEFCEIPMLYAIHRAVPQMISGS